MPTGNKRAVEETTGSRWACMNCGSCESRVIDSRGVAKSVIRRRRRCVKCGERETSYEIPGEKWKELEAVVNASRQLILRTSAIAEIVAENSELILAFNGIVPKRGKKFEVDE
jgi:Fe-S oxidoreductase